MTNKVDVTCIVVGHRESHIIGTTIRSVIRSIQFAKQCGLSIQFIIALDRADTDTENVVSKFVTDGATLFNVDYGDLSKTRNKAVTEANGNYVTFIDGDDLWCRSWIVDSYRSAQKRPGTVWHPEFNIYFGNENQHVFNHVDMDDDDFIEDAIYQTNYWTALSFSEKRVYENFQYRENRISEGFGYEDWTWNFETIKNGITHHVARGTSHFIRRTNDQTSLLNITNSGRSCPTILPIYSQCNA